MGLGRGLARLAPRLFLCLVLLACTAPEYTLRTVKIGLVAPLSGPKQGEGARWAQAARNTVRGWNQTALAGRPYRVELIIYDEAEGPVVARRLLLDAAVLAVACDRNSPIFARLAGEGVGVLAVGSESDVTHAIGRLLEAVTATLEDPASDRRQSVLGGLRVP